MKTRLVLAAAVGIAFAAQGVRAHCDGLDGPVVGAARRALAAADPAEVLIWVQPADEAAIRDAFAQALSVRKLGGDAKKLADTWFFETLVRVHRAGEGAPFTGLKPAGRDLGPAIPAADKALETGDARPLEKLLTEAVATGVREKFQAAKALRKFDKADVAAGRRYVAAYVAYIHFVERLHEDASRRAEGHFPDND
jgi:hypothetical protein